ncbi:hypothetical protein GCM10007425_29500 [Lysinibacillus alkalisoli]|uniref:Uncharacterized protein n=1 Tax=Lysinibacillus alkalisoli TaxID=1911548 RepID=A0A917LJM7_9BACI|nr:phage tail protein [Lysinibacillus alkalisoli]GGG32927.1 hypothetical protein GCM10007425_29500 [Lysinibacillus alkalisoli]
MVVSVHVDKQRIKEIKSQLDALQNEAPSVISRSMNRAITAIATSVNKGIRKEYRVEAASVKKAMKKKNASAANLSASVQVSGSPIGLNRFKVSPKTVNPKRRSQLKISVKKTGGGTIPGAFNADVNGIKVMKRTGVVHTATKGNYAGKRREKIERKFGPSVPQMAKNEEIASAARRRGGEVFEDRLKHEIQRLLGSGS